jgi:hypothetical protein
VNRPLARPPTSTANIGNFDLQRLERMRAFALGKGAAWGRFMAISPITPAALLVPALVQMLRKEMTPRACGQRGVGKLRRDFSAMGPLPTIAAAEHVLAACCKACGRCNMSHR